jgi:hypothetical protein
VAVVTASTQGIGLAIAERLGLEGAAVVISSRKQVQLSRRANLLVSLITLLACCLLLGFSLLLFLIGGFLWIDWRRCRRTWTRRWRGSGPRGSPWWAPSATCPTYSSAGTSSRRPSRLELWKGVSVFLAVLGQIGATKRDLRWVTLHYIVSFLLLLSDPIRPPCIQRFAGGA